MPELNPIDDNIVWANHSADDRRSDASFMRLSIDVSYLSSVGLIFSSSAKQRKSTVKRSAMRKTMMKTMKIRMTMIKIKLIKLNKMMFKMMIRTANWLF